MSQQKRRTLQAHLSQANAQLEQAKLIADELGETFEFLGRTYTPRKTVVTGGTWDHENAVPESWDESDSVDWNASGIGC